MAGDLTGEPGLISLWYRLTAGLGEGPEQQRLITENWLAS